MVAAEVVRLHDVHIGLADVHIVFAVLVSDVPECVAGFHDVVRKLDVGVGHGLPAGISDAEAQSSGKDQG